MKGCKDHGGSQPTQHSNKVNGGDGGIIDASSTFKLHVAPSSPYRLQHEL